MAELLRDMDGIIVRYLLNEADVAEQRILLQWLKEDISNQQYFYGLKETWEASRRKGLDSAKTDDSWTLLKQEMEKRESDGSAGNRKILPRILRIAATITLLTGIGFALFTMVNRMLNKEVPVTYTEIQTLNGQKKEITLPDGTSVWLNSGTCFKYPSNYGKLNREVYLQGEAFFDVTRDETKTFIVRADNITIRVLGTSFNVNCYPNLKTVETTVISGIVSLENANNQEGKDVVILNKLEKATYLKDRQRIYIVKDNSENALNERDPIELKKIALSEEEIGYVASWKDQTLSFNNETFMEMAVKLQLWFDVSIIIDDENLKSYRYKGKFNNVKSIYQVLEVIRLATPITYDYNEKAKEITIKELKK